MNSKQPPVRASGSLLAQRSRLPVAMSRPELPSRDNGLAAAIGVLLVAGYATAVGLAMSHASYDAWDALLWTPPLLFVSAILLRRAARRFDDPWVTRVLWAGLLALLVASFARTLVASSIYGGASDSHHYSQIGAALAHEWRAGHLTLGFGTGSLIGDRFTEVVTAAVYFVVGPSFAMGSLVFAWLAFWGLYFCYRGFRLAFPDGDHRRYAKLLFFMPSMLIWLPAIGKEAWMLLTIGLAALGAAKLYTRERYGYACVAAGLLGTAMVRPNMTVLVMAGIIGGYVVRPRNRAATFGPLSKLFGLAVLLGAGLLAIQHAASFLHLSSLSTTQVSGAINQVSANTSIGGSSFDASPVHSITGLPKGVLDVFFAPFPWQARNPQSLLISLEAVFLLLLFVASFHRLARFPKLAFTRPYVMLCIPYILLFAYAFSGLGNYGILTRERVQVLPFLFVLAALPRPAPATKRSRLAHASRTRVRPRPWPAAA